eukprot:1157357-Pelagomonas_calceolata.AAC.12
MFGEVCFSALRVPSAPGETGPGACGCVHVASPADPALGKNNKMKPSSQAAIRRANLPTWRVC